jgi:hypothetical protein
MKTKYYKFGLYVTNSVTRRVFCGAETLKPNVAIDCGILATLLLGDEIEETKRRVRLPDRANRTCGHTLRITLRCRLYEDYTGHRTTVR